MEKILIVDDEPGIRTILYGVLTSAGYRVEAVESGEEAFARLAQQTYDLLCVDLQMTGVDGLEVIRHARATYPHMATAILTGFATVDSAVEALHQGVDDYLVKPASPEAIRRAVRRALNQRQARLEQVDRLARIAAEVQSLLGTPARMEGKTIPSERTVFERGPLRVDEAAYQATWNGKPLQLTSTEFKLLAFLAHHAGQALSVQELVAGVQGYHCDPQEARELIKPHLYHLRAAIEPEPAIPRYLINVRGVGYLLQLDDLPLTSP